MYVILMYVEGGSGSDAFRGRMNSDANIKLALTKENMTRGNRGGLITADKKRPLLRF